MSIQSIVSFNVKSVGDVTGTTYEGLFECKTKLSVSQGLKESEMVRRLLGVNSQEASNADRQIATAIAYLAMRVTKSPQWWKDSAGGQELEDLNVLADVNNEAMKAVAAEYDKLSQEAEKAQPVLREELNK